MANQVKTVFSVDTGAAIRAIDAYEKRLRLVTDLESKIGAKTASSARTASAGSGQDQAMKAAMADIAKMQRERERMSREATRAVERDAKAQANAQVREAKRSADAMIAELKRVQSAARPAGQSFGAGGGFLGQVADQMGVSPAMIASFTAAGAAVTALAAAGTKLIDFYSQAADRASAVVRANRLLESSSREIGLSFASVAAANRRFAADTGLSTRESAQATSMIARLAANAGMRTEADLNRLSGAFADLGAARGIAGQDLQNLMGTILSGQDEGLNRLGIADPGQLQKAYAASIGTTVDKLTQQQKVTAAVNAVLEKSALYTGAAAERMNSLEGALANATSAWSNFADAVSRSMTDNPTFRALLTNAAGVLRFFTGTSAIDKIREDVSAGRQISDRQRNAASQMSGGEVATAGLLASLFPPAALAMITDPYARQVGVETAILDAQTKRNNTITQNAEEETKRREAARKAALSASLSIKEQDYAMLLEADRAYYARREALLTAFGARNKQEELEQARETARIRQESIQSQIQIIQRAYDAQIGALAPEDAAKARELADKRDLEVLKQRGQLELAQIDALARQRDLQRQIADELKGMIVDAVGQRNPFVAVFDGAYQALTKVAALTKEVGAELRQIALESVQKQALSAYENVRVSSALQAFNLTSSAADFRSGINLDALSPRQAERRRLRLLRGQLEAIGAFEAAPTMQALPTSATSAQRRAAEENFRRAQQAYEARRASLDRQVIDLTQGVNPARLDRETRDLAAGAREREAGRVADQEREARALFKSLQGIINPDGIRVVLGSGEQIVRIIDESDRATVERRPNANSVGNRYGN